MVCDHGENPRNRRCVTSCYGLRGDDQRGEGHTMIAECMLCGAVRTYKVIEHAGPTIEYGPWQTRLQREHENRAPPCARRRCNGQPRRD